MNTASWAKCSETANSHSPQRRREREERAKVGKSSQKPIMKPRDRSARVNQKCGQSGNLISSCSALSRADGLGDINHKVLIGGKGDLAISGQDDLFNRDLRGPELEAVLLRILEAPQQERSIVDWRILGWYDPEFSELLLKLKS